MSKPRKFFSQDNGQRTLKEARAVEQTAVREVKKHLQCPLCYHGLGGTAQRRKWQVQVSGSLVKRCYVCGECGTEWVVEVRCEDVDGIEYKRTKVVEVRQ